MFKLTKAQLEQRAAFVERLNDASTKIEEAVDAFNAQVAEEKATVEAAVTAYNEILSEVREFAGDIATQADQDISDKSEKWQEGERGQAAVEFKDAWEGLSLDDIEVEYPEELSIEEPNHADELDGSTEEASF